MSDITKPHACPSRYLAFNGAYWVSRKRSPAQTRDRLKRYRTRPCSACLGTGVDSYDRICELCDGWGELMVLVGGHLVRRPEGE